MDQPSDAAFQAMLQAYVVALNAVANGQSGPIKALCSQRDDISQCGMWGGVEHGWAEVSERWDWVAAQFVPGAGAVTSETVLASVTGDLAYAVVLERWQRHFTSQTEQGVTDIRVTLIFRQEDGEWKAVHRHGDTLLTKAPPAAA